MSRYESIDYALDDVYYAHLLAESTPYDWYVNHPDTPLYLFTDKDCALDAMLAQKEQERKQLERELAEYEHSVETETEPVEPPYWLQCVNQITDALEKSKA